MEGELRCCMPCGVAKKKKKKIKSREEVITLSVFDLSHIELRVILHLRLHKGAGATFCWASAHSLYLSIDR